MRHRRDAALVFALLGLVAHAGAGDGKLYRLDSTSGSDAPGAPVMFRLVLGDGLAAVGSPTIDTREGFLYAGPDAGIVYTVELIP